MPPLSSPRKDRNRECKLTYGQGLTKRFLLVAVGVGVVLGAPSSFAADQGTLSVVLRDGEHVRGELLSLNNRDTNMRDGSAHTLSFRTDSIVKLDSRVAYAVETEAGERLNGKISIRNERHGKVVYVATAELRRVPLSSVVSIGPVMVPKAQIQPQSDVAPEQRPKQVASTATDESSSASGKASAEVSGGTDNKDGRTAQRERQQRKRQQRERQQRQKDSKDKKDPKVGNAVADEEDAHSLFLRQVSVLFGRRQLEISMGFSYLYNRWYDPAQNRLTYSRDGQASLALSFGIASFLQATIAAPLVLNQEHTYRYTDSHEEGSMSVRLGNVTGGINMQLLRAARFWPDVMLSAGVSLPIESTSAKSVDQTGRVHWSSRACDLAVTMVKTSDPVSLVVGASYGHVFDQTIGGQLTQPGDFWGYMLGLGFAVNTKISLLTDFHGGWQAPSRLAGKRIVDSESEPMTMTTGLIYAISKSWYVSPAVTFPLNTDATTVMLALSISHRL